MEINKSSSISKRWKVVSRQAANLLQRRNQLAIKMSIWRRTSSGVSVVVRCIHTGWMLERLSWRRRNEALCHKHSGDNTCLYLKEKAKDERQFSAETFRFADYASSLSPPFSAFSDRFYRFLKYSMYTQWAIKIIVGYYKTNSYIYKIRSEPTKTTRIYRKWNYTPWWYYIQ